MYIYIYIFLLECQIHRENELEVGRWEGSDDLGAVEEHRKEERRKMDE